MDTLVDWYKLHENDGTRWASWYMCVSNGHDLPSNRSAIDAWEAQSLRELKLAPSSKAESWDKPAEIPLRYCFIHKGIILEQTNILACRNHNEWVDKILACRIATVSPGYSRQPPNSSKLHLCAARMWSVRDARKTESWGGHQMQWQWNNLWRTHNWQCPQFSQRAAESHLDPQSPQGTSCIKDQFKQTNFMNASYQELKMIWRACKAPFS